MLAEFAARLAVALPLVCLAAVATLMAVRRGWLGLPAFPPTFRSARRARDCEPQALSVACVKSLSPAARLAVVRFQGRELLLGVSGPSIVLLAGAEPPRPPLEPEQRP